ncbi:MAG: hypothetical protein HY211_01475 [Candidatus Omnitrophica bacterium]|nr:hypothetical protein [Candidatus Omnitrophota bacterium]
MKRYQLHYPKERPLEDLVDEVSWALWERVIQRLEMGQRGSNLPFYTSLRNAVGELLQRHVTQYDLCGLGRQCEEGVSPSPWASGRAPSKAEERAGWYVLEVNQGLEELVKEVADGLVLLLLQAGGGTITASPVELQALAEESLKQSLGPHLFENISCGETLLCRDAVKLNPWLAA